MKVVNFLMVTVLMLVPTIMTWGQQVSTDDASYLSKVSLKQYVSEESFLVNYPTGYEQTVNKRQLCGFREWKKRDKLYKRGLEAISSPQKALRYFMKGVEKYGDRDASYQVGHFFCFGVFDETGIVSRKELMPIDAKKGLSYLNFASPNKLCKLFADKDSWMFDPRRAVFCGIMPDLRLPIFYEQPIDKEYKSNMVESIIKDYAGKCDFKFDRFFADNFKITLDGEESAGWILYRISQLAYLSDVATNHTSINHKGSSDINYKEYLSSQYLLQGFDYMNKNDEPLALFYFTKAGYAGNADGFRMAASMLSVHCTKRWPDSHYYRSARALSLFVSLRDLKIPEDSEFYPEYQVLLEEAKTRFHEEESRELDRRASERAAKKEKRARFWNTFAQGIAVGAATAAQGMTAHYQNYVPRFVPTTSMSTGFSTDYYTSSAYLNQVQMRADQSMANYQAQMQRIGQQAMTINQQGMNRINQMSKDLADWTFRFNSQNGRYPTDYEKTQWVSQNYPDMLNNYVLSQGGGTSSSSKDASTASSQDHGNGVDYRQWYQRTEENIASLHRSFSTGSTVTTTSDRKIKDTSSTSGGTYLQMQQTYRDLRKELKRIREEAAQNGVTISPSQWETSTLKP